MLKNYLLIAFRTLIKNQTYSFINIIGLGVGWACFLLIALFVQNELKYEQFHEKANQIYRLSPPNYARTAPLLAPTVKQALPEIEKAVRLKKFGGVMRYEDQIYTEKGLCFAAQDFLEMFSFDFIQGKAEGALESPNHLIINETTALKYFNSTDVVGKELLFLDSIPLVIKGVFKDWPSQSHVQFNMLGSFETYKNMGSNLETWRNNIYYTYILLNKKAELSAFNTKLQTFVEENIHVLPNRENYQLVAQNLKDIHLYSNKDMEWQANGSMSSLYIFSALALMVLLISCINFMNLSTAIASKRAKEIGVRKTIGARFKQLVAQFLTESTIMSGIGFLLALILVKLALPYLNDLAEKNIELGILVQLQAIAMIGGGIIVVGLLAGIYPALVLSSFRPLDIFKGKIQSGIQLNFLRKGMLWFQFALSLLLLSGTLIVFQQLQFMKNQALGFDKEQIIVLPFSWDGKVLNQYDLLKTKFLQHPDIQFVTASGDIPGRMATRMSYWAEGMPEDESKGIQALYVHRDFVPTYGLEVISGRAINNDIASDLENGYLLNETAVKTIGWTPENAIGKRFAVHNEGTVIGVVKDFHYNSLQQKVEPLFLAMRPEWAGYISIRSSTQQIENVLVFLEKTWQEVILDRPFAFTFLDEDYNRQYLEETRLSKMVSLFSFLAIFIACIGLFGLATFAIEKRQKEIAIRKVLGASFKELAYLLSKDFMIPIFLAILLATPLAFWIGQKWLSSFAYSTSIQMGWLFGAALILIVVAWGALGFQSFKATRINPIQWLKEE